MSRHYVFGTVLEKTQGHVVTFFKWLKDPPHG